MREKTSKRLKTAAKSVICGLLGLCLVAPLAACNGGGLREKYEQEALDMLFERFEGELERGTPENPTTLHILENDTAKSSGYLKLLLDGFNEKYAEYNIVAVDANNDQYSNLAENGPHGFGPDVLYQANDMLMKYCAGKHIIPLPVDKLDAYNHLPDEAIKTYTYSLAGQDYLMGVGVNVQAPMLYYRKDLLPENWKTEWDDDKNGVPDMVEDFTELYAWSNARNEADSSKFGYMQSIFDAYFSCGFLFSYGAYVFGDDNTDTSDIGFGAGDSNKGARVLWQLAESMDERCIDDSITVARESELASGNFFAVNNTQDMYTTMINKLSDAYKKEGLKPSEAKKKAEENLVAMPIPDLPVSGDLNDRDGEKITAKVMGGINGYAMSSYTEYPVASLAFINYATSKEMILTRNQYLGVSPVRKDANAEATEQGDVAAKLMDMLESGAISIMPSVSTVDQIWTPLQTCFTDLATDPYRNAKERKFTDANGEISLDKLKNLLDQVDQNIYDAIYTLA